MKKIFVVVIAISFSLSSCGLFKKVVKMDYVVKEKQYIDSDQNPADKTLHLRQLRNKKVELKNVLVKDITSSSNIDYDFCVIADVKVKNKIIECYIYSKNIKKLAKLKKGKSIIDVKGEFSRFFTMLDEYYTKIEITKSVITLKNKEDEKKVSKKTKIKVKEVKEVKEDKEQKVKKNKKEGSTK